VVKITGSIRPFRILRTDLVQLATSLHEKMMTLTSANPVSAFDIKLERFSTKCNSIVELERFLADVHLPRVIHSMDFWIWENEYCVNIDCDFAGADYVVDGAKDISEAKSIEELIIEFRRKHKASPILSLWPGYLICTIAGLGFLILSVRIPMSSSPVYHVFLVGAICTLSLLGYFVWASFTNETPPLSFRHFLLYMDSEPKNNVFWVLVSGILTAIVATLLTSFLFG
jgi:hypothetical protein